MPYAFSSISDSEILDRVRAGEAETAPTGFGPDSLRELGESSRLGQGGIAQLSIVNRSIEVAHRVSVAH